MIKFGLAVAEEIDQSFEPGVVVEGDTSCVGIGTAQGVLRILQLQRPGGKMLPAEAFLLGNPIAAGERFLSREMHPLVSPKPVSHKRVFQLYTKP
jgi:methionyl-tRNA formyltransferase